MTEIPHSVLARPASAVVLAREQGYEFDVFMVRRHIRSEFVPDAFVFPGGSVQDADYITEQTPGLCSPTGEGPTALGTGFRAAALRECFEEAGVLLARHGTHALTIMPTDVARFAAYRDGLNNRTMTLSQIAQQEALTLATDELLHWTHWITPATFPKRFDTHFFFTTMPDGQDAVHDQLETTDSIWIRPAEALMRYEQGDFPIVFATIHQLRELRDLGSILAIQQRFTGRPPETVQPRVVQRDGQDVIVIGDDNA